MEHPDMTAEEGAAVLWLVDFVLSDPRGVLHGSRWPADLGAAVAKLERAGYRNPYYAAEERADAHRRYPEFRNAYIKTAR